MMNGFSDFLVVTFFFFFSFLLVTVFGLVMVFELSISVKICRMLRKCDKIYLDIFNFLLK